jgi:hypothetical protein
MSEKCACVSIDALTCSQIRYGIDPDEDFIKQPCECPCHEVDGEDEVAEWIEHQCSGSGEESAP